jgi:hypothetical protein
MVTGDMATAEDTVTTVRITVRWSTPALVSTGRTGIAIIRIRGDIIAIGGNPSLGTFLSWREWSRQLI